MIDLDFNELRGYIGLGVAGNFAGHLEQAGEAADFATVDTEAHQAPKGIFPYYVPGSPTFLGRFPLSPNRIAMPPSSEPLNLQIEPEVGLVCDIEYQPNGDVGRLGVVALGAFNDCSIRRPDARKISEKKNWGVDSQGVAGSLISISDIEPDGPSKNLRLASFLRRDGESHAYGVDSAVSAYSYYGSQLLEWIVDRMNNQPDAPGSPLESVAALLAASNRPARALIGIGATRYTEFGASNFLRAGDESVVVVYDGAEFSQAAVAAAIEARSESVLENASTLVQTVYDAAE
jgi:hypothetical protein